MTRGVLSSCIALALAVPAAAGVVTVQTEIEINYDVDKYEGRVHAMNLDVNSDGVDDVGFGFRWDNIEWAAIAGGPWDNPNDQFPSITPGALGVVTHGGGSPFSGSFLARRFGHGSVITNDLAGDLSYGDEVFLAEEHYIPPASSERSGDWIGAPVHGNKRRGFVAFLIPNNSESEPFHWGWVDVTVDHADPFNGYIRIHGWGYETDPFAALSPFPIPSPGGSALMLIGATVMVGRRRSAVR